MRPRNLCLLGSAVLIFFTGGIALAGFIFNTPIVPNLIKTTVSTVPANGDTNPYGVAFVPKGFPEAALVKPGDILVSNFNNSAALGSVEGTGTTIVVIDPASPQTTPPTFFTSTSIGLTLALGILNQGFVVVGNVPSTNGNGSCTSSTEGVAPGSLQFLDKDGTLVLTLTNAQVPDLNGPWGLAINQEGDLAQLFVANVLSGTVIRIDLKIDVWNVTTPIKVISETVIASGYTFGCFPVVFVAGPSGLAYDSQRDILYVSSTQDQTIYAVNHAAIATKSNGTGKVVVHDTTNMHGPIGLLLAPNGDFISAQGDGVNPDPNFPSEIVEFTPKGVFISEVSVDPGLGAAFGIALEIFPMSFTFAAVDDVANTLEIWTIGQ